MKSLNEQYDRFENATCRIDHVVYLAGALAGEGLPDVLEGEFFSMMNNPEKDLKRVFGFDKVPKGLLEACEDEGDIDEEGIIEELIRAGKLGFMIQIRTPVMEPTGNDASSYSWGYTTSTWVYDDDFEAAIQKGLKWVESVRSEERDQAGFKSKKR